jgi:hypothetical protein
MQFFFGGWEWRYGMGMFVLFMIPRMVYRKCCVFEGADGLHHRILYDDWKIARLQHDKSLGLHLRERPCVANLCHRRQQHL